MASEEKITKSFLEKAIHERAVNRWEQETKRICKTLAESPFSDSKLPLNSVHVQEDYFVLGSRSIQYSYACEDILKALFDDYGKIKEKTIKEYEQDETQKLLDSLSGIGDYLRGEGEF